MVRLIAFITLCPALLLAQDSSRNHISREHVTNAEKLIGIEFSDAKRDSMLDGLKDQLENFRNIRKMSIPNDVPPAILFNPIPVGMKFDSARTPFTSSPPGTVALPANLEELAFYSVGQLSELKIGRAPRLNSSHIQKSRMPSSA